jgi:hypothetical protein
MLIDYVTPQIKISLNNVWASYIDNSLPLLSLFWYLGFNPEPHTC